MLSCEIAVLTTLLVLVVFEDRDNASTWQACQRWQEHTAGERNLAPDCRDSQQVISADARCGSSFRERVV